MALCNLNDYAALDDEAATNMRGRSSTWGALATSASPLFARTYRSKTRHPTSFTSGGGVCVREETRKDRNNKLAHFSLLVYRAAPAQKARFPKFLNRTQTKNGFFLCRVL